MTQNSAQKKAIRDLANRAGIPYAEARTRLSRALEHQPKDDTSFGLPETYRLRGLPNGRTVVIVDGDGTVQGPLPHYRKHSPDGFTWGYAGSGPAELARCILIAVLGQSARCTACKGRYDASDPCWCEGRFVLSPSLYQTFKFERIATLPEGEWEMPVTEVQRWLFSQSFQIARGVTEDFAQPYDLYMLPDGHLLQQDFWRGENYRVVGCVASPTEHGLMDFEAMVAKPDEVIGRHLVTSDLSGRWSVHTTPIIDFQPRG